MMDIFDFRDYRAYLISALGGEGRRTGQRRALAEHLGCQSAFVSQVLKGPAHFSLEQALRINDFLSHTQEQQHYFMLLISMARAGSVDLENYYRKSIDDLLAQRMVVKNRLGDIRELSPAQRSIYYSHWHYAALHVAVSVPELQTIDALAKHFLIPVAKVRGILDYLLGVGLVEENAGKYSVGRVHIHLGQDADLITRHHTNWRLAALSSFDRQSSKDLHYSVVYSLSRKDAETLREKMIQLISENLKTIGPSDEEVVYCHAMDFFEV